MRETICHRPHKAGSIILPGFWNGSGLFKSYGWLGIPLLAGCCGISLDFKRRFACAAALKLALTKEVTMGAARRWTDRIWGPGKKDAHKDYTAVLEQRAAIWQSLRLVKWPSFSRRKSIFWWQFQSKGNVFSVTLRWQHVSSNFQKRVVAVEGVSALLVALHSCFFCTKLKLSWNFIGSKKKGHFDHRVFSTWDDSNLFGWQKLCHVPILL